MTKDYKIQCNKCGQVMGNTRTHCPACFSEVKHHFIIDEPTIGITPEDLNEMQEYFRETLEKRINNGSKAILVMSRIYKEDT